MLVTSLNKLHNLETIIRYSEAVMAGNDSFSLLNETNFSITELKEIQKTVQENNKKFILKLNLLLHESKIEYIKEIIAEFSLVDAYYVQDLGVVEILTALGYKEKIIYDPGTMICNSLDAAIYKDIAPYGIGLSAEIPLDDVEKIIDKTNAAIFYKVFGYHSMCYSKRHLISLFLEENKLHKHERQYYLKEEKRPDFLPVIEREYGTIILRSHVIHLLQEIFHLDLKFMFIETFLLTDEQIAIILEMYYDVIRGIRTLVEVEHIYEELNIPTSDGFSYEDSIYLKEELNNV